MSSSFEFPELKEASAAATTALAAEREAERREEQEAARERAYEEGLAAGRAEIEGAARALEAAAAELGRERERTSERAEAAAAELALQLAEKIVGAALEVRPELVVEVARGALRRQLEPREATLLVNPDDLELIDAALTELGAESGAPLRARAERRVPRGGCVLRSPTGEIDGRVAEQLARARAVVAAELGS